MSITRNRTSSSYISLALYLYFLGLSTRNVAKAMSCFLGSKRSHVAIWKWFKSIILKSYYQREKGFKNLVYTRHCLKLGLNSLVMVALGPKNRQILALNISKERNVFVAERFLSDVLRNQGKHPVSTDGGAWYSMACKFLKLKHHVHSSFKKSIIERTMQYIKDRTECFDDYFPCKLKNCKLKHVINWLNLFVDDHNKELELVNWTESDYVCTLLRVRLIQSNLIIRLFSP